MIELSLDDIEITDKSWMKIIICKRHGYVDGTLLADQIEVHLLNSLRCLDEDREHIRNLTGQREMYKVYNKYNKKKGWYIHPFLALQILDIRKNEDSDYIEYYEFMKEVIFEFLDRHQELKELNFFIEEFHG